MIGSGKYVWQFAVHSEAHLDEWLKDYFGGINITHEKNSTSVLTGVLPGISAVYGLIMKLRDSGISVISLQAERKSTTERRQKKAGLPYIIARQLYSPIGKDKHK